MSLVEVLVLIAGAGVVLSSVLSAVRTIVLPHGESSRLNRAVFVAVRYVLNATQRLPRLRRSRDEVTAMYAPLALVCLPLMWLTIALGGFTAIFWALDTRPLRDAFKLAGSSMLTIGFFDIDDLPRLSVSFFASGLTISLLALVLVTYLPTMYQAYSTRETAITSLETFAGEPPDPVELIVRHHRIGAMGQVSDVWEEWRSVFFELRETHTANPAVVLFRSSSPDRNWVQAMAAILDAAALWNSACTVEQDPQASLSIRAGALSLADIAQFFGIETLADPRPDDPIEIGRETFDDYYRRLGDAGIELPVDPEEAWIRWRGWRVNYDAAVVGLLDLLSTPGTR